MSWQYAQGRRFHYILAYVLFVFATLTSLLEPLIMGLFFNHLQAYGLENYQGALLILLAYPASQFIFWIFHGTARVLERITAYQIVSNFREDLFDTLSSLPLKWHKDHHSGEIMSRLEKASNAIKGFADEGFMYHEVIVKFVGSTIALFVISAYSGAIAVFFGIFAFINIFRFDKVLVRYIKNINGKWHIYDATFYDYVTNMRTVITLRLEKLAKKETVIRLQKVLPIWKKNAKVNELKWFFLTMVIAALMFSVLAQYLFQLFTTGQALLFGTLIALHQYVYRFTEVFYDLAWKYENLVHFKADIDSINLIWKARKDFGVLVKPAPISTSWKTIQINNLYFRYEDETHSKHTLKNVSVKLHRGERIAFVGESGSGKSTMMSLLRGLEEPNKVKVIVDGEKASGMRVLSDHVTLIPQDPEIFENTIEYNVTAGIRHRKSDVDEAIKMARFEGVLKRLPKGLKMNIKEKGVNLSGGEKQRLALARGIFAAKNSSIVLLDEPTSSVDPSNELKIYENLFKMFKDKCLISSIHRLHLLPHFDKIYFFQDGKLLAEGDFETLLKKSPEFKSVWDTYKKTVKK